MPYENYFALIDSQRALEITARRKRAPAATPRHVQLACGNPAMFHLLTLISSWKPAVAAARRLVAA